MKRYVSLIAVAGLLVACSTNPFTGAKNLNFVSNASLFPQSVQYYNQVLGESKVLTDTPEAKMIDRVGEKIRAAAETWMNATGNEGYLKDYAWEYSLIDSEQVNAWALPAGKIAFYTGILPIAENETAVAAIMGHEVAHALANHSAQRMSAAQLQQIAGVAVAVGTSGQSQASRDTWMQVFGIGSQVGVMLPFSRNHESEADKIGIYLMAIAGYNPDEASKLWERMDAHSSGEAPPEILSTHPAPATRIAALEQLAPLAREEAKKFGITTYKPIVPLALNDDIKNIHKKPEDQIQN